MKGCYGIRLLSLCLFEFGKCHSQLVPGEGEFIVGYDLLVEQSLLALQFDTCRFRLCLRRADVSPAPCARLPDRAPGR